jgi:hypothetical protein
MVDLKRYWKHPGAGQHLGARNNINIIQAKWNDDGCSHLQILPNLDFVEEQVRRRAGGDDLRRTKSDNESTWPIEQS